MCSVCSGISVTFNLKWLHQIANSDLVLVWLFMIMIVFSGWVVSIFFTLFSVCWTEKDLFTISSCKHLQGLQEEPPRDLWVYHHPWLMSGKVPYPSDHLLQMMLLYSLLLLVFISESYINPCHTNLNLCVLFMKKAYKETETSTEFTRIV